MVWLSQHIANKLEHNIQHLINSRRQLHIQNQCNRHLLKLKHNNIRIYANDSAGNINTAIAYFTIDNTAPTSTIVSPTARYYNSNFTVNATITDSSPILSVQYRYENSTINSSWFGLANTSLTNWNTTFNISSIADGNYTFRVNATDIYSNSNTTTALDIAVDKTKPTLQIILPANATYPSTSRALETIANEPISQWT